MEKLIAFQKINKMEMTEGTAAGAEGVCFFVPSTKDKAELKADDSVFIHNNRWL